MIIHSHNKNRKKKKAIILAIPAVVFVFLLLMALPSLLPLQSFAASTATVSVTVKNESCTTSAGCTLAPVQGAVINSVWYDPAGAHKLTPLTTGASGSVVLSFPSSAVDIRIKAVFPALPGCPSIIERIRNPTLPVGSVLLVSNC